MSALEFSPRSYEVILDAIQRRGFEFARFGDLISAGSPDGRVCLLRHDVDVSMDFALEMAQLEARRGVRATYFVMLRSPLYNLCGRHAADALRELVGLGHEIGLHFDAAYSQGCEHTTQEWIAFEMSTLAALAGTDIGAFSFHQPSAAIIEQRIEVAGAVNTYHPDQLAGFKYISDSNRVWREYDPLQLLEAGFERIHLLLHPIWWMCDRPDMLDCWDTAIRRNFDNSQRQLLATERAYGSPRRLTIERS
jgi:hypothetical protein